MDKIPLKKLKKGPFKILILKRYLLHKDPFKKVPF